MAARLQTSSALDSRLRHCCSAGPDRGRQHTAGWNEHRLCLELADKGFPPGPSWPGWPQEHRGIGVLVRVGWESRTWEDGGRPGSFQSPCRTPFLFRYLGLYSGTLSTTWGVPISNCS